jgi:hypothetical protein
MARFNKLETDLVASFEAAAAKDKAEVEAGLYKPQEE